VLDSLNPFETDAPIEELVRAGLPTYGTKQKPCETSMGKIAWGFHGP